MSDVGPREHCDLQSDPERLEQQEETEAESNDAGPDHRERANDENEHHRGHCVVRKLAFGCEHTLPFLACSLPKTRAVLVLLFVSYRLRIPN